MPRIPLPPLGIEDEKAVIGGADYRHMVKALRLGVGDEVTLFGGDSREYTGVISSVGSRELIVDITGSRLIAADPVIDITILQGLPKGEKMDYIVEKATELGAARIVPVVTERSQVRKTEKHRRWERIALEASKQCGRTKPTLIENTLEFKEALLFKNESDLAIILHTESSLGIKEFLRNTLQGAKNIIVLIGPEGGFSQNEVLLAIEMGFTSLGLGPRILRTETASLAVLSIIQFQHGDL
ncbi:MAG: 16S rRNA (uracil(1498)-N(3))-methyltransferase [Candidatus Dadabacteria bacterium]|jgi:16S rRNA (uracil1498-N3)-methyltransferase|nr:16S rRNA (uracil(1498)-N(3))-methyltransferase [Candidatus Dadabacteria bacterium]